MPPFLAAPTPSWCGPVLLYLGAGFGYLLADPRAVPPRTPPSRRTALAVALLCSVLWPLLCTTRAVHALHTRYRRPAHPRVHMPRPRNARTRTTAAHPAGAHTLAPTPSRIPAPDHRTPPAGCHRTAQAESVYAPDLTTIPRPFADWSLRIVRRLHAGSYWDAVLSTQHLLLNVERIYGPQHHHLWNAVELQAHICHLIGDTSRAIRLYLRAADGWAANFGVDHPTTRAAVTRARALAATTDLSSQATLLLACWERRMGTAVSRRQRFAGHGRSAATQV